MAQFLRPDANVTQTSFTGGFADLDESTASDADFAYGDNNTAATLEVGLSNPSGTPGSGTTTVRYRVAKTNAGTVDGAGNACDIQCHVYQGTTLIASDTARTVTGTWTTYSFTPNMGSVTDWNNLRLRFVTTTSGGSPANRRGAAVSWGEIEAPDLDMSDRTGSMAATESGSDSFASTGYTVAPISSLTDDFGTGSVDTNKWVATNSNGTVSIVSGALDLTTTGAAGSHATLTSANAYRFQGSESYVQVVRPFVGTNDVDGARLIFRIVDSTNGGNRLEWFIQTNGNLVARTTDNGGALADQLDLGEWSSTTHKWLKISESGGTVTWWTAPDSGNGTPGTWTSRHTYAPSFSMSTVKKAMLWVENWGTGHGAITQSGRFDGFNTAISSGVAGSLAATDAGPDTFASTGGEVEVVGSLSGTEGADTFASTGGEVEVAGSLAVTEGADALASTGTVTDPGISGSLAVTESGADALTSTGAVAVAGSLAVTESGADTLASTGTVAVAGSLAVTEAATDAFLALGPTEDAPAAAFTGGELGFWLDATPAGRFEDLSSGGTPLTAYDTTRSANTKLVGKWIDRSGNNYNALEPNTANRGNIVTLDGYRYFLEETDDLTVANAGGSTTEFYFAAAISIASYYGTLFSDQSTATATNGLRIFHSADGNDVVPMMVFAANGNGGTGGAQGSITAGNAANQVRLDLSAIGHTLYSNPSDEIMFVVEFWYDGTRLYGRLNGGTTIQSTNTVSLSAGGTTAYLNSNVGTDVGSGGTDFYEVVCTKNHLPDATTRDSIYAYLVERIVNNATLAVTDAGPDAFAADGEVTTGGVSGSLAATDNADTFASSGVVAIAGSLAATDGADTLAAGGSTKDPISTLTENFESGSIDSGKWASSNTNGTISVVSGELDLTTTGAAGSHATITSVNRFNLDGSEAYVRVIRPYLGTNAVDGGRVILRIYDNAGGKHGDYVEWYIESNSDLGWRTVDTGSIIDGGVLGDWTEASHAWLKISKSGGTVTWWTAPDSGNGTPGTWTQRHTYSALPSAFRDVNVALWVENWGTGHGAITQSARLDGLNTAVFATVAGSLAATDAGPDTFASTGEVEVAGSLATADGADTFAATAVSGSTGALAATDGTDAFASTGAVPVVGSLAATDGADTFAATAVSGSAGSLAVTEGSDTFASTGAVPVAGSLAATDTADTFASTGIVTDTGIVGSLAATETGSDSITCNGAVPVAGSLAATDGADAFAATGVVPIAGSLAATDDPDTLFATSSSSSSGTMAATEVGEDALAATVDVLVTGELAAAEAGEDTASVTGEVVVTGLLDATDSPDVFAATGEISESTVAGSMAAAEGSDVLLFTGAVTVIGAMSATEQDADDLGANGSVPVVGTVVATEPATDSATISGSIANPLISTLSDNFTTLDSGKWVSSSTNGTISIVGGALDLTTTGAAGSHATVTSVGSYDLRGSEIYVKLVRPCLGTNDVDGARMIMRVYDSVTGKNGDYVEVYVETNGTVGARTVDNGTPQHITQLHADWGTSGYAWFKISLSGGTATWWTAPDVAGSPGTWTSRHTRTSLPSTFANVKVALWLENWGTGHGAITQSGRFDGLNTTANSAIAGSMAATETNKDTFSANAESFLLLTDYGAVGNGTTNNWTAFQNAFAAAASTGKTILVPAGVFAFEGPGSNQVLEMTGIKMKGIGTSSVIHALNWAKCAIYIQGNGTQISNLKLTTAGTYSRQSPWWMSKIAVMGGATNFLIDRLYIERAPAASIHCTQAAANGVIKNCTIYDSLADSIHITDRCSFIEVHNNEIYNSGDDGVACVSYTGNGTPCHHITAHHNKFINHLHGRNMSVVGGEDVHYYQNYIEGNLGQYAGIIVVSENNVDWQTLACKRIRAEYNTIKNTGSANIHAAVMIFSDGAFTNDDIDFVRNWVIDDRVTSPYPAPAFRLFGPQTNVLLDRNKIDNGSGADYQGVSGDPDITLILYDSGTFGQTEAVGPAEEQTGGGGGASGSMFVNEGADGFASTATVKVAGSMAAAEPVGKDTFNAHGKAPILGALFTVEQYGLDGFAATATSGSSGSLTAVEPQADAFASTATSGSVGSLSAAESSADAFASAGVVAITGDVVATAEGVDTFAGTGTSGIVGTLAVAETGSDVAAFTGTAGVSGDVVAVETPDIFAADGVAIPEPIGFMAAVEATTGTFVATGNVPVIGSFTSVENPDTFGAFGDVEFVFIYAYMDAIEAGSDSAVVSGVVPFTGALAATESADVAASTGTVAVAGSVVAVEASDVWTVFGEVDVEGNVAAVEQVKDGFQAGGFVGQITGSLAVSEVTSDWTSMVGSLSAGGTETLHFTSLVSGSLASAANALGAIDGVYTADTGNTSWSATWNFAARTPDVDPNADWTFTLRVRKSTGTSSPTISSIVIRQGATTIASLPNAVTVVSTTGQDISVPVPQAAILPDTEFSVDIVTTAAGGSPSARSSVQVDGATLTGEYSSAGGTPPLQIRSALMDTAEQGQDAFAADVTFHAFADMDAVEAATDTFVVVATVRVNATLAATEVGEDAFAATSAAAIAGSLAVVEDADVLASTGTVPVDGSLAATEGVDAFAATGSVSTSLFATLAATEGADTASLTGAVPVTGSIVAAEAADILLAPGAVPVAGSFAVVEQGSDTASITGSTTFEDIFGSLAATDSSDTASATGAVPVSGVLASTGEGTDAAVATGAVRVSGSLVATDGADAFTATSSAAVSGSLAATDGADAAAFTGSAPSTGSLSAVEPVADAMNIQARVRVQGAMDIFDQGPDTASGTGALRVTGNLAVVEQYDKDGFDAAANLIVSGSLVGIEVGKDGFFGTSGIDIEGTLAATDSPDSLSIIAKLRVTGFLAAADVGEDTFTSAGGTFLTPTGTMAVVEQGEDTASATGTLGAPPISGGVVYATLEGTTVTQAVAAPGIAYVAQEYNEVVAPLDPATLTV